MPDFDLISVIVRIWICGFVLSDIKYCIRMVWKAKFENINQLTNRKHRFPLSHIHNHANTIGYVPFWSISQMKIDLKAQKWYIFFHFRQLLDYIYSSEITISKENVQSLLSAANLLEILPVRDACCQFLDRHMDESNCLGK